MPNNNIHLLFDKIGLGKEYPDIHNWIDDPVKELGPQHRKEHHDISAIIYCGKRWGNIGLYSSCLHMLIDNDIDCKLSARYYDKIEKIKVDEKIRTLCDLYYESLADYYSGNLRSYKAKVSYSKVVSEAKENIPKDIRINIKNLTQKGERFVFYSDIVSEKEIKAEIKNQLQSVFDYMKTGIINPDLRNIIWDYKRKVDEMIPVLRRLCATCYTNNYEEIRKFKHNLGSAVSLTVEGKFDACHNISTFPVGHKCHNLHGHQWKYRCSFIFQKSNITKISEDFGKIKQTLKSKIEDILDHSNLNDVFEVSSAEEISKWIFEKVSDEYEELMEVVVKETETSWITYSGDFCEKYFEY